MSQNQAIVVTLAAILFITGCETSTQMVETRSDIGLIKKAYPAAVLNGEEVSLKGLVKVQAVGTMDIDGYASNFGRPENLDVPIETGAQLVKLEGSFNNDGMIYIFEADMDVEIEGGCHYYPVGGFELNTGKAWMWIQDQDHQMRVTDRVEAELIKSILVAKAHYTDDNLMSYESIIDPEVMEDRRAACDTPPNPLIRSDVDESYDRGDLLYSDRIDG